MTVILLVLKIIGILLLSLLGIVLLLSAFALLVPIRYQIRGEHGESVSIEARVHWLLHLVSLSVSCKKKEWEYGIFLCGFRIRLPAAKNRGTGGEEPQKASAKKRSLKKKSGKKTGRREAERSKEDGTEAERSGADGSKADAKPDVSRQNREPPPEGERISGAKRFQNAGKRALDTQRRLREKLVDIKSLLADETAKKSASLVFAELKYLLRHFRFRRIKAELAISLGDPAATGIAFGALSMLPFVYREGVGIHPDFEAENARVEGHYEVSGHIRLFHGGISLIRLWKKKEFRIFVKRILKQLER